MSLEFIIVLFKRSKNNSATAVFDTSYDVQLRAQQVSVQLRAFSLPVYSPPPPHAAGAPTRCRRRRLPQLK